MSETGSRSTRSTSSPEGRPSEHPGALGRPKRQVGSASIFVTDRLTSPQAATLGRGVGAGLLLVPALFVLAGIGVLEHGTLVWLETWASTIVFVAAAGSCATRAWGAIHERAAWAAFAVACSCWAGANLYYALAVSPDPIPLPSPADIGYFSFPLAIGAGLLLLTRARVTRVSVDAALDGLIVGLAGSAVAAAVIFNVIDTHTADFSAVITSVIYPLEDVAVIGIAVAAGALLHWRLSRVGMLLAAAVLLITLADVVTFSGVVSGSGVGGAWTNAGWTTAIAFIALAAWQDVSAGPHWRREPGRLELFLPTVFSVVALVVLATAGVLDLGIEATVVAAAALCISTLRLLRAFREIQALADSRRLAVTDELTGLRNRRGLLADLSATCDGGVPHLFALFDLDGFKSYNDTFGHSDGDVMLADLSARFDGVLPPGAKAYRLGGDEFCMLAPAGDDTSRTVAMATAALSAEGDGWCVSASYGTVTIPDEAPDVTNALRLADQRMYAQKARRPAAARQQAKDVLLSVLSEQQPTLRNHVDDVTVLVSEIGQALGMSEDEIDDAARAAELHDIGKLAIPLEILDKPGPLDEAEWAVIRNHTVVGERMLLASPALASVAPLVRASHERWDGKGYPDGLAGEEIPLGARIISVCDSFDAITADRPYRAGRSVGEALAELQRCAGSQFDQRVVSTFATALTKVSV